MFFLFTVVKHLSFSTSHRYVTKPWVFSGTVLSASFSCCKNMGNAWLLNYFIPNFPVSCILFFFFFTEQQSTLFVKKLLAVAVSVLYITVSNYWLIITIHTLNISSCEIKVWKNSGLKGIQTHDLYEYCTGIAVVSLHFKCI